MKKPIQTFLLEQTNAKIDETRDRIDSLNIVIHYHEQQLAKLLEERNQLQGVIEMALAANTDILSAGAD